MSIQMNMNKIILQEIQQKIESLEDRLDRVEEINEKLRAVINNGNSFLKFDFIKDKQDADLTPTDDETTGEEFWEALASPSMADRIITSRTNQNTNIESYPF